MASQESDQLSTNEPEVTIGLSTFQISGKNFGLLNFLLESENMCSFFDQTTEGSDMVS